LPSQFLCGCIQKHTDGIWEEFKQGTLDNYIVPPNQLADLNSFMQSEPYKEQEKQGNGIKKLEYLTRAILTSDGMKQNLISKQKVRQALTMAIDLKRIIKQISTAWVS